MSKHHIAGPSTLDSLSKCIRFKYGSQDDDAASEGQELHNAAERESTAGLTDSQAKDVQTCLDYVNSLKATEGGKWKDGKERQVELKGLTHGTCDRILVHMEKPIMHVLDWKFTRVETDHEFQVETYGAAAFEEFGDERDWTVYLHVVEPRLPDIKTYEWNGAVLHRMVTERIKELYERIDNPWNPETPSQDTCAKCARAAYCPALNKTVAVAAERMGLPVPEAFEPGSHATLRDRAIAQVLAGAMENWAKLVKQANAEHCKQTGEVPEGFKLVTRSTGLKVAKDMTPIALQHLEEAGFDRTTLLECCSLTIGEVAEKHSAYTGVPKAEVKEQVREALGDLATEGECSFLQKSKRVSDEQMLLSM